MSKRSDAERGNAAAGDPWGDLLASLENSSSYLQYANDNSAPSPLEEEQQYGSNLDSFTGSVNPNFDNDVNAALRASVQSARDEMNRLKPSPMSTIAKSHQAVPLRQWIKQTIQATADKDRYPRIGALSISYLKASITVAISLAKQISKAEGLAKFGISQKLDALPIGRGAANWVDYTTVFLQDETSKRTRDDEEDEWQSHAADYNSNESDDQVDISDAGLIDTPTRKPECLCVQSAEIKCPESDPRQISDHDKLHRVYNLALVYYELFSGDVPPQNLRALASFRGAFISLSTMTLVKENGIDDVNDVEQSEPKRCHSTKNGHGKSIGLCKLSFEYLKLMRIPGPICHLIFNMLDCVYGDFSGNESYTNVDDVIADLELMLDKPRFIEGVNVGKLISSGLSMEDFVVSRDQEQQSIMSCYRRCLGGAREIVIITGESGVGKSHLVKSFACSIISESGIFLMGKFDAIQQSRPFSALAAALDQYCDLLACQLDSSWANAVIGGLQSALGNGILQLVRVLPKLSNILNINASSLSSEFDGDFGNAVERIQYLLCLFIDVIALTSPVSVTLCLDDVQWADEQSISLLHRALSQKHNSKFFFVACCRDDEMPTEHPFWKMVKTAQDSGVIATTFKLKGVEVEVLSTALSDLLCLTPRLVKPLSKIIHSKTKGNLLFITQILRSFNLDGLLRVDLDSHRWVWDEDKIFSSKLPDNVAVCFTNDINKLPTDVQLSLQTLSMFGASAKHNCMTILEQQLKMKILQPLQLASSGGFVITVEGSYQFCHDMFQEVLYNMIPEQSRTSKHLTYGRCLIQHALQSNDIDLLFTAINQINRVEPEFVADVKECCIMAKYNHVAGKKAMEMSDFSLAHSFFQFGISFLRAQENHWTETRESYTLSLELFNLAAKSALSTGDFCGLKRLTDEVMKCGRCFEDTTDSNLTLMLAMYTSNKMPEALEKGIEVVTRLGESIPVNPSQQDLEFHIKQTQIMIKGKSEQDILNYKVMEDAKKLIIMKFFCALQSVSFLLKPDLHHFIVLQMVKMTLMYGISPTSPIALAGFGCLLAKFGDIQVGHQFALLANSLSDKIGAPAQKYRGELIFAISQVKCFCEPIQAIVELQSQGANASMLAGDVRWRGLNLLYHGLNLFWVGSKLAQVKEKLSSTIAFMKAQNHQIGLGFISVVFRTVLLLSGESDSVVTNELNRIVHENKTPRSLKHLSFHNMYVTFMLGDGDIEESSKKFCELDQKTSTRYLMFGESVKGFIAGLISFRLYRKTGDTVWAERGKKRLSDYQHWETNGCKWNFMHKRLLLLAEKHYSNNEFDAAKECYKSAISAAIEHKFLNDAALSHEHYGRFLLETGDLHASLEHFIASHEKYSEWGAIGKANQLFQYINEKFSHHLMGNGTV